MIIFHEGLPGSGKSYEAMLKHVLPALQKGRVVFGYIDGVEDPACRAKVAQLAGLTTDQLDALWKPIREEDLPNLPEVVADNSFVVIDEVQDHWPAGRLSLPKPLTTFVTQHRHRGIDVLLMGQLLKDVHSLWRGRVDQRVVFNKLDAVGAEKRYSINVMKASGPGKFVTVVKTIGKYDPAYFGMYKSVTSDAISTEVYKDKRATVWGGWGMRFGLPIMGVVAIFAAYKAWSFFHPDSKPPSVEAAPRTDAPRTPQSQPATPPTPQAVQPLGQRLPSTLAEAVKLWSAKWRPRINVQVWTVGGKRMERGSVEWYDDAERVQERQTLDQLRRQGIEVVVGDGSSRVAGILMTSWQLLDPKKQPYGAQMENGQPATTSGRAGLP